MSDDELLNKILQASQETELPEVDFWGPPCFRCFCPLRLHPWPPGHRPCLGCGCEGWWSFADERRYVEEYGTAVALGDRPRKERRP